MPFSSTPVIVSPGDTIEIRYPTPDTWDTNVSFQIQIGQGTDTVTIGTKVPDAAPDAFQFFDQYASESVQFPTLPGDFDSSGTNGIQRNTTYYSEAKVISGIELRIPIRISSSASGPRPSFPNLASSAAFTINDSVWINEANSFVPVTLNTVSGSRTATITSGNEADIAVGRYIISPNITGEVLQRVGNVVTLVDPASATGSSSGNSYFTVQPGDTVRLRVQTEDWYTTNSNVTLTLSDNYWTPGDQFSTTWSLTTRAQDQTVSTLTSTTFVDYVDERSTNTGPGLQPTATPLTDNFGAYKTTSIDIIGIDADAIVEATSTGDMEISLDQVSWSQNIPNLTFGDVVFVRTLIGNDYATKTSGSLTIFANPGQVLAGGFENNTLGTFGADEGNGNFEVTQVAGTTNDNQQVWTEVDRYPDPIPFGPNRVFTFSDANVVLSPATVGEGYTVGTVYNTNTLTGVGSGLTFRVTEVGANGSIFAGEFVERGIGYTENDTFEILGGIVNAQYQILQYRQVNVSSTDTVPNAEINRTYYVDVPITGLGTEYPANTYSDLEAPQSNQGTSGTPTYNTTPTSNDPVEIRVNVTQGSGQIRKNGAGTWVQQLYVQDGDILNFRLDSPSDYNITISSTIRLAGPPFGGPTGNPSAGPLSPTYSNIQETLTLTTRAPRTVPYRFRAEPKFDATPGQTCIAQIPIEGLDANTTISIVSASSTPFSNAAVSSDGVIFSSIATLTPSTPFAYIRIDAGPEGTFRRATYQIGLSAASGLAVDRFVVYTQKSDYTYVLRSGGSDASLFLPQWADSIDVFMLGAGGGDGGQDLPSSFGGQGAPGNILIGTLLTPESFWPAPFTRRLGVVAAQGGTNGEDFDQGASGGDGGFGYATGGFGGDGSTVEYSGGGGGGGGASAINLLDPDTAAFISTLLVAGGGAGGAGAGADTIIQTDEQNGNQGLGGGSLQPIGTINFVGENGVSNSGQGGGGGGAGGGWGSGGNTNTQQFDSFGGLLNTTDLDGDGGTGGGWYFVPSDGTTGFVQNTADLLPGENGAAPGNDGYVLVGWAPQDTLPDAYSWTDIEEQEPNSFYQSNVEQITGITGPVSVSVSGTGNSASLRIGSDPVSILSEPFTAGGFITNGQYLQLQLETGPNYNLVYSATSVVGTETPGQIWRVETGPAPDEEPNPPFFDNVINAPISTLIESNQETISGINVPVVATADAGAEIRVGVLSGGSYVYGPYVNGLTGNVADRTLNNGDRIQVRITSSALYSTIVQTQVIVGTSDPVLWTVTTEAEPDTEPDTLVFITKTDQDPLVKVYSNYQTITDISEDISVVVDPSSNLGGSFVAGEIAYIELNGTETDLTTVTVSEFDIIRLYYTTTATPGAFTQFPVTAGTAPPVTWTVGVTGSFGTTPNDFNFGTNTNATPGAPTPSIVIVTIAGITAPGGVDVYGDGVIEISVNGGPFTPYTAASPYTGAVNGDTVQAQLNSPPFPGFSTTRDVIIGSGAGSYTVFTTVPSPEPLLGQWYSSLNVVQDPNFGGVTGLPVAKFNTKFDGLPIGTMMPAFKDSVAGDEASGFGDVEGSLNSRFPGFIWCYGQALEPDDYPALFDVIGYTYGQNFANQFRLPDFRNKKLVGTGPVDGQSASSPALAPQFGPQKTTSNKSSDIPGSHGGLWFIDTIASPSSNVIPQVDKPATGQPPQDSQFYDIGTLKTSGYSNVSGVIEFTTSGQVTGPVSLKDQQLFEVPFHIHELLTGQPDPAFKGIVNWGSYGGYRNRLPTDDFDNADPIVEENAVAINLWGFGCFDVIQLDEFDTIRTTNNPTGNSNPNGEPVWIRAFEEWSDNDQDTGPGGCIPGETPGYLGTHITDRWNQVNYIQSGLNVNSSGTPTSPGSIEINEYINLGLSPYGGFTNGEGIYKWVGAIDIPSKNIAIAQFKPIDKLKHSHYLTFENVNANDKFSFGNESGPGTAFGTTPSTSSIDVVFTAADLGLEVLPGTFVLDSNIQLTPTPSFAPQEVAPLITPYVWCKWLIKAY